MARFATARQPCTVALPSYFLERARMGWTFWTKRFALALMVAGVLLFAVQLAKGHEPIDAAEFAAFWGVLTAAVFTLTGYIRYRRNPACMIPPSR